MTSEKNQHESNEIQDSSSILDIGSVFQSLVKMMKMAMNSDHESICMANE